MESHCLMDVAPVRVCRRLGIVLSLGVLTRPGVRQLPASIAPTSSLAARLRLGCGWRRLASRSSVRPHTRVTRLCPLRSVSLPMPVPAVPAETPPPPPPNHCAGECCSCRDDAPVVPFDLPSRAPHKPTQNRIFINRRRPRNALPVFVPSCVCGLWWDLSHVHLSLSLPPSLPLPLSLSPSLSVSVRHFAAFLRVSGLRVCLCERVGPREFHQPVHRPASLSASPLALLWLTCGWVRHRWRCV